MSLVALQLQSRDPTLDIALDWAGPVRHSAALAAFFAGDFFLAKHSGNYFGKELIPNSPNHLERLRPLDIPPSRVCLHCWHAYRELHLEDEAHALFHCPLYWQLRADFSSEISYSSSLASATDDDSSLRQLNSSYLPRDWTVFAKFVARIRQVRKKMWSSMASLSTRSPARSFDNQRKRWRRSGKVVCKAWCFLQYLRQNYMSMPMQGQRSGPEPGGADD